MSWTCAPLICLQEEEKQRQEKRKAMVCGSLAPYDLRCWQVWVVLNRLKKNIASKRRWLNALARKWGDLLTSSRGLGASCKLRRTSFNFGKVTPLRLQTSSFRVEPWYAKVLQEVRKRKACEEAVHKASGQVWGLQGLWDLCRCW